MCDVGVVGWSLPMMYAGDVADWPVVGLDAPTARLGGSLWRRFGPSHGTGIMDALLAATAQRERARLATINRRHFPMLDDLLAPY
jgi:predicted nucleic acid-binding protein